MSGEKKIGIGPSAFLSNDCAYNYSVGLGDDGIELIANLRKNCNISFDVYSSNPSIVNSLKVKGITSSTPTQETVVEGNTINVEAATFYDNTNYIYYYFEKWDDGNTQASRIITATSHDTCIAEYKGYATTSSMNVQFVGDPGDPITIDWDDHSCSDVTQYKVWRYPSTLLATLNRGTTTYADRTYTYYDGSGTSVNLNYAVTAYYSPDQTWSTPNWLSTTGEEPEWNMEESPENERAAELSAPVEEIKELSLANHPNPFNPETIINYINPEKSMVAIKVYDMLGREVRTLVNEIKDAGNYSVRFNASSLPSGVYIYTIETNRSTLSKKMILMK